MARQFKLHRYSPFDLSPELEYSERLTLSNEGYGIPMTPKAYLIFRNCAVLFTALIFFSFCHKLFHFGWEQSLVLSLTFALFRFSQEKIESELREIKRRLPDAPAESRHAPASGSAK